MLDYRADFYDGIERTSLGNLHFMHHKGGGEKLLFLHGLGGSTMSWSRLVGHLPPEFDVTLLDLLGHGKSDAPRMEYRVSAQFQALREFVSLRNNGDSHIVGHSYGGWIAAYYASQPCTCRSIILISPAGLKEYFDEIAMSGDVDGYMENLVRISMRNAENREYVIRSTVESDMREDQLTSDALAMIKVPSLVLWGANDELVNPRFADVFTSEIRGCRKEIISGAGHNPHFTSPDVVASAMLKFISSSVRG